MEYNRAGIYYVDFGDCNRGNEQGGIRPAIVISNNVGNKCSNIVMVIPITSKKKARIPTHMSLSNYNFLDSGSVLLTEQITTKDKKYILDKIGNLNDIDTFKLEYHASISLQMLGKDNCEFKKEINNRIDELKYLKGYIDIHKLKYNETKSISYEIYKHNKKLQDFKNICYINKINYRLLYNCNEIKDIV